jgi:hypothetical protein
MASRKRLRDRIHYAKLKREEARLSKIAPVAVHPFELELARAGSLKRLEQLDGVGGDHASRAAFWRPFASLPARETIEAGCAELRRRARQAAGVPA